jgi:hypothetical protein
MKTMGIRGFLIVILICLLTLGPYSIDSVSGKIVKYYDEKSELDSNQYNVSTFESSVLSKQEQFRQESGNKDYLDVQKVLSKMLDLKIVKLEKVNSVKLKAGGPAIGAPVLDLSQVTDYDGLQFEYSGTEINKALQMIESFNLLLEDIKIDYGSNRLVVVVRLKEVNHGVWSTKVL